MLSMAPREDAGKLRELLASYTKAEDLINIGAYVKGSNPKIDKAIEKIDSINNFLRQVQSEKVIFHGAVGGLGDLFQ